MRRWLIAGGLLFTSACESSPVLPTAAEGPPPFSRIAWDWTTISPAPGTPLTVGQTLSYSARAFFEFSAGDLQENASRVARLDLEARWPSSTGTWWSNGDLDRALVPLEDGVSSGGVGFSGTIRVPEVGPDCYRYEELSLYAYIGREEVADTVDSEKSGATLELRLPYSVEGASDTDEPCVVYRAGVKTRDWAWGEYVTADVQNAEPEQDITFALGDGPRLSPSLNNSGNEGYAYMSTFLPVGSSGGEMRIFVDDELAMPGGGLWTRYNIPEPRDFGDPMNDRWDDPQNDQYFRSAALYGTPIAFYALELALNGQDRLPAPELNPWGWDEYGRGDWWWFLVDSDYISEMCVLIQTGAGADDEVDLYLTTSSGEVLDEAERFPGTDFQWLVMPIPDGPHIYYVWVAPKVIRSTYGRYWLRAAECSWFGSPEAQDAGRTRTVREPPLPPTVAR